MQRVSEDWILASMLRKRLCKIPDNIIELSALLSVHILIYFGGLLLYVG